MDRLLLVAAALLFSTGGAAIKACSLPSWQVACFRSGVAAVTLFVLFPKAIRGWTWRTCLIGLAYAATLVLFVVANKLTTSANAIFLQSTAPLYLLLLGPLVLREPIRRFDVMAISLVGCGAFLLLLGSDKVVATAANPARGNIIAACSGVTWALTIVGLRALARHRTKGDSSLAAVISGNFFAFACCAPAALPVAHIGIRDLAIVLYLGVFQVALAYFALTRSIRRIPAFQAAVLLLFEPVFNPIWSWVFHGEKPTSLALAGGFLIVSATLVLSWQQANAKVSYFSAEARLTGTEPGT